MLQIPYFTQNRLTKANCLVIKTLTKNQNYKAMPPLNHLSKTALTLALSQAIILPAQAATIIVNTNIDAPLGLAAQASTCSLRAAVESANTNTSIDGCSAGNGADSIDLTGINGTITLSDGELVISSIVTVNGPGQNNLIISGNNSSRIFNVDSDGDATIEALTLTGGSTIYSGGAINNSGVTTITDSTLSANSAIVGGGGISSLEGAISITDSTLSGNSAFSGGAVYSENSTTTITNSVLSGNYVSPNTLSSNSYAQGGGIFSTGGHITITNSTLSDNSASLSGGAMKLDGGDTGATIIITNTTLSGNHALYVGGVSISENYGPTIIISNSRFIDNSTGYSGGAISASRSNIAISNSTFSDNYAGFGGAVEARFRANITISNSTLTGNGAQLEGGGIRNDGGTITISNSTVSNNSARDNGGGIYSRAANTTITSSIITGNFSSIGSELYSNSRFGSDTLSLSNSVLGNSAVSDSDAFFGVSPNSTNVIATSDQLNIPLSNIIDPLADNGGPTLTHALPAGSPALDAASNCPVTDQRGEPRDDDDSFFVPIVAANGNIATISLGGRFCDIGAVEIK